jgi:hypothetical protein
LKKWNCDLESESGGEDTAMTYVKLIILNTVTGHKKGVSDRTSRYCEMRDCAISALHQISQDDAIKQDEMGWMYSMHVGG